MSTDSILFQDIFDIKDLDPQGKRFDRGKGESLIWIKGIHKVTIFAT